MRVSTFTFILKGIAFIALSPFLIYGQLLDPVQYKINSIPDTVKAGEIFEVVIEAEVESGWHLYSVNNHPDAGPFPTTFSTGSKGAVIAGMVQETDPDIEFDPNFNTELGWHSEQAEFSVPVAIEYEHDLSEFAIDVLYQVCDDVSCLPPKIKNIQANVTVKGISENPFRGFTVQSGVKQSILNDITSYLILIIVLLLGASGLYYVKMKKR